MGDPITLLFGLLSLLALGGVAVLSVMLARPSWRVIAVREFGGYAMPAAAIVAAGAMLGSLYMSEVAGFVPCRLCWAQRGFMYPLAAFLIVAAVGRWDWAPWIGLPVAIGGGAVALFHYAEQQAWIGGSEGFCDAASPCTDIWVEHFGFVSIPFMSMSGFVLITTLMWLRFATRGGQRTVADPSTVQPAHH